MLGRIGADGQAGDFQKVRSRGETVAATNTRGARGTGEPPSNAWKNRITFWTWEDRGTKLPKKNNRAWKATLWAIVRCVIKLVDKSSKGPGVVVRAPPRVGDAAFEQEFLRFTTARW
jgi:hypothetical protein